MKSVACFVLSISIFFVCLTASSFSYEFLEPDPDSLSTLSVSAGEYHLYGTEGDEFDISTAFPAFNGIFDLYVTNQIAAWDSSSIAEFILAIIDSDTSNSDDAFPLIWDYFCHKDADPTYEGIEYSLVLGGDPTYTKIRIFLYDLNDFDCNVTYPPPECRNWSFYSGYDFIVIQATDAENEIDQIIALAFTHELQHLCYMANGAPYGIPPSGYSYLWIDASEMISTAASHLFEGYEYYIEAQPYESNYPYDASIYRREWCDPNDKYVVEELWTGYLIDVYDNDNGIMSDDLVYNWIRYNNDGMGLYEISMNSLAETLADLNFSWIGGLSGDEKLRNLFQYFLVAKFCNAPTLTSDNRFGYKSNFSPVSDLHVFVDACDYFETGAQPMTPYDCPENCHGLSFSADECAYEGCPSDGDPPGDDWECPVACWNVRILPPDYTLGSGQHNVMTIVDSYYTDSDGSIDTIDVPVYGTDYIIFRADNYFQDNEYHELHFRLEGENSTPSTNKQVKMWIIGYDSTEDTLQLHPEDIVFIESSHIDPNSTTRDIVVGDFGSSVKSAVIAITYVENTATSNSHLWDAGDFFAYQYEYGVYTPDTLDIDWKGDVFVNGDVEIGDDMTLTIYPGTNITVPTNSESADEDRIEALTAGEVFIEGTATDKIKFKSDNASPSTGDWDGIRFASGVSKITISYAEFYHADTAIESDTTTYLNCCFIDSTNAEAFDIGNNASIDSSTIYLNSDHIIESGDTFSVTGNTTFYIGTEDLAEHWNDTTLVEFWNFGVLDINGDSGDKVEFKSTSASTYGGDWMGIKPADSTVTTTIRDCVISDAVYGIKSSVTVTLRNVEITNSAVTGIYLYEDENTGAEGNESTLDVCTFSYNDSTDATGMQIWNCDSTIVVDSCEVNYNGGYGMWVSNASPEITCTEAQNNGNDGLHIGKTQTAAVEPYVYRCDIQNNGDDGIYFGSCGGDVQYTRITDNETNGAYCRDSNAYFKRSKIIDNPTGIRVRYSAVTVGDASDTTNAGYCTLDNDTYNIHYNCFSPLPAVMAERCWWGESPPVDSMIVGNVDYTPFLSSEPSTWFSRAVSEDNQIPTKVMLYQNFPNPLVGGNSTQIKFSLPKAEKVSITVYDVAGRKVKTLASGVKQPGHHYIRWDGHNDKGARVATGIYFYQMKVGSKVMSKKIVLIR